MGVITILNWSEKHYQSNHLIYIFKIYDFVPNSILLFRIFFGFFFFISSMILSILISFFCLIVLFIPPYNDLNFIIFFRYLKKNLMKIDQSL